MSIKINKEISVLEEEFKIHNENFDRVKSEYLTTIDPDNKSALKRKMDQTLDEMDRIEIRLTELRLTLKPLIDVEQEITRAHEHEDIQQSKDNDPTRDTVLIVFDAEFDKNRLNNLKHSLEAVGDRVQFVASHVDLLTTKDWRNELVSEISQSRVVLLIWNNKSDKLLIIASFAELLRKPLLFFCYEDKSVPPFFNHRDRFYMLDQINGLDSAITQISNIVSGQDDDYSNNRFSQAGFEAAFFEEFTKTPSGSKRSGFERKFRIGIDDADLYTRQLALVRYLAKLPFGERPKYYQHDNYQLRYDVGIYLNELNGLDDEIWSLTKQILTTQGEAITAMVYMFTCKAYHEYKISLGQDHDFVSSYAYYPYTLSIDRTSEVWKREIENIESWVSEKKFNGRRFRIPTFSEWKLLAGSLEYWDIERLAKCNLANGPKSPQLATVGIFHDSASPTGCFDIIGNAWELVRDQDSSTGYSLVGWSFEDPTRTPTSWEDLRCDLDTQSSMLKIGFRLLTLD